MPPLLRVLTDRRLWLAILASLLLHIWIVAGSGDWLPDWLDEDAPMEVTLALSPPILPPKPVVAAPPAPAKMAQPRIKPPSQPPAITPHAEPAPPPATPSPPEPAPAVTTGSETVSPPPVEQIPESVSAEVEEAPPVRQPPPRRVELEYLVDYQGAGGSEKHLYVAHEDGTYQLSSLAEPKGLAALVASDLMQKSEGRITAQGLAPGSFIYQYGKNENKAQKAMFDWQAKNLVLEYNGRKQNVALEEGAQDILSFMYQFMFVPPLEQFDLAITTGKRLRIYTYGFEGEEEINTGAGKLHTLHISRQGAKGEEKDELWLAPDYHYLPVKIRKIDKDGKTILRTLTKIKIDEAQ